MHSGSARPSQQNKKKSQLLFLYPGDNTAVNDDVSSASHLDGGHQTGQDQPYDTPPSPSQQAPKSFRD